MPAALSLGVVTVLALTALIAALPRRIRRPLLASVAGCVAGAMIVILVYPPCARWIWGATWGMMGLLKVVGLEAPWGTEWAGRIDYRAVRSGAGGECKWSPADLAEVRRWLGSWVESQRSGPRPPESREVPVTLLESGIPIHSFDKSSPVAGEWKLARKLRSGGSLPYGHPFRTAYTLFRTRDGKKLFEFSVPWKEELELDTTRAPDTYPRLCRPVGGRTDRVLFTAPAWMTHVGSKGLPFALPLPESIGFRVFMLDVDQECVVWRRAVHTSTLIPSGTGRFLAAGNAILDMETGEQLHDLGTNRFVWTPDDRYVLVRGSDALEILDMASFRMKGRLQGAQRRGTFLMRSSSELAVWKDESHLEIHAFPSLEPVGRLTLITPQALLARAALAGTAASAVSWLLLLMLPMRRPRPPAEPESLGKGSRALSRVVVTYLVLLPVMGSWNELPIKLSDGTAACSIVLVTGALFALAWVSSLKGNARLGVILLLVIAPSGVILGVLHRSTEWLKAAPAIGGQGFKLVNERWVVDVTGNVLRISDGGTEGHIDWAKYGLHEPDEFGIVGDRLFGRQGRYVLEWSTTDWSLRRATILGVAPREEDSTRVAPSCRIDGRILPVASLWDVFHDRIGRVKELPEGRILYSYESGYVTEKSWSGTRARTGGEWWIGLRSFPRVRFLEIPLHAGLFAMGFGVLSLLFGRRDPTLDYAGMR